MDVAANPMQDAMGGGADHLRRRLLEGDIDAVILAILCLIAIFLAVMGVVCQWIDRVSSPACAPKILP